MRRWLARWYAVTLYTAISLLFLYSLSHSPLIKATLLRGPPCGSRAAKVVEEIPVLLYPYEVCIGLAPSHPDYSPTDLLYECSADLSHINSWMDARVFCRLRFRLIFAAASFGLTAAVLGCYQSIGRCQRWWVYIVSLFLSSHSLTLLVALCVDVWLLPSTSRPVSEMSHCHRSDPRGYRLRPDWAVFGWWMYGLLCLYCTFVLFKTLMDVFWWLAIRGQRERAEKESRERGEGHDLALLSHVDWQVHAEADDRSRPPGLDDLEELVQLFLRRNSSGLVSSPSAVPPLSREPP